MASELNVGKVTSGSSTQTAELSTGEVTLKRGTSVPTYINFPETGASLKLRGPSYADYLTISSTGLATFSNGIAFQSATTGSGTGTGYTLDSYEEGTWTPTYGGTGAGAVGASSAGQYTKIGRIVVIQCQFTATTNFNENKLGGLPFQPRIQSTLSAIYGMVPIVVGGTANVWGYVGDNVTAVQFLLGTWSGATNHLPGTGNGTHRFALTYETDA